MIFDQDGGTKFAKALESINRLKAYRDKKIDLNGQWFIELERNFLWSDMQLDSGVTITDPGQFRGAFYFFHLDKLDLEDNDEIDSDDLAVAGLGIDRKSYQGHDRYLDTQGWVSSPSTR